MAVTMIINPFIPNEIGFNLFRGLQGLVSGCDSKYCAVYYTDELTKGAAANVPTAIGILGVTFPPGKAKNYAFSAYGTLDLSSTD